MAPLFAGVSSLEDCNLGAAERNPSRRGRRRTARLAVLCPGEAKGDKALQAALALIRGTKTNPAFAPSPKQAASEP